MKSADPVMSSRSCRSRSLSRTADMASDGRQPCSWPWSCAPADGRLHDRSQTAKLAGPASSSGGRPRKLPGDPPLKGLLLVAEIKLDMVRIGLAATHPEGQRLIVAVDRHF